MEQLLTTKLNIPSLRSEFVPRPHLIEQLNEGLHRKLTLVSGSAGFGKTSFVAEWCWQAEHAVTWLSLDKNDNDPARFINYLIAALQKIEPEVCQTSQSVLNTPQPINLELLLTGIVNDIDPSQPSACHRIHHVEPGCLRV